MKIHLILQLALNVFLLSSCALQEQQQSSQANTNSQEEICYQPSSLPQEANDLIDNQELGKLNIVTGQKIYAPLYSQLHRAGGMTILDLTGILTIHNTSNKHSIFITSVRYYDTSGQFVKDCLPDKALRLGPMANTEFGVSKQNRSGGSGANFVVEWVAEKDVKKPIVETIMITSAGNQGYSFLTTGRVIEELK